MKRLITRLLIRRMVSDSFIPVLFVTTRFIILANCCVAALMRLSPCCSVDLIVATCLVPGLWFRRYCIICKSDVQLGSVGTLRFPLPLQTGIISHFSAAHCRPLARTYVSITQAAACNRSSFSRSDPVTHQTNAITCSSLLRFLSGCGP